MWCLGLELKTDKIKYWPTPSITKLMYPPIMTKRSSKFPPTLPGNGEMKRSIHFLTSPPILAYLITLCPLSCILMLVIEV